MGIEEVGDYSTGKCLALTLFIHVCVIYDYPEVFETQVDEITRTYERDEPEYGVESLHLGEYQQYHKDYW